MGQLSEIRIQFLSAKEPTSLPHKVPDNFEGFSYDAPHPAALAIVEQLKNAMTTNDIRKIIWKSFSELFSEDIAGTADGSSKYSECVSRCLETVLPL